MAESNKILTVSYGTFSCTLEGFDDAFTTMKAIAEYFRDLAADDRFFGAEPPTPDAEMLARLASQTASRRVEARRNDTGIVLRQEAAALATPAAAAAAPAAAPAPAAAAAPAPPPAPAQATAPAAPAPSVEDEAETVEETTEPVAVAEPAPETVAEPAPVAEPEEIAPVAEVEETVEAEAEVAAEPEHEEPVAEAPAEEPVVEEPVVDEAPVAETPVEEVAEPVAAAPVDAPVAAEDDAPVAEDADDKDEVAEAIAEFEAIAEAEVEQQTAAPRPVVARNKAAVVTRRVDTAPAKVQPAKPRVKVSVSRPVRVGAGERATVPHPDQNSVAAKLARIRGVVAKARRDDDPVGYTEDQHADASENSDIAADLAKAFEADAAEDTNASDLDATRAAIAAELAERDAAAAAQDHDEDEVDVSAAMAIANAPHDDDEDANVEEAVSAFFSDADDDDEDAFDEDSFFADEDEDDADTAEAAEDDAPRQVSRVLKVKRRDFEAAVAEGALEEDEAEEAPIPDAIRRGESSLSPEDETELQNELMALEQEIARGTQVEEAEDAFEDEDEDEDALSGLMDDADEDEDDEALSDAWELDDTDEVSDEDEVTDEAADQLAADTATDEDEADEYEAEAEAYDEDDAADEPINPRRRLLRGADDDMDRILAETNNQLGDSDGTRRRSAIAHLRAAVAATKAEKQAGAVTEDDEQEVADVYRDDLAQVVRPRRPVVSRGTGPSRRAEDRPAPLKLVAEQRVDLPGADAGPVRPRRVRMSDMALNEKVAEAEVDEDAEAHARAAAANAASFNEFAERVGAVELPDLLEAAASYLAFVEGREQFTRPQLMVKARQAMEDEFSREDGLRHFGRLLREGKLRKVAAGQFSVSDRINFRPEERAVG